MNRMLTKLLSAAALALTISLSSPVISDAIAAPVTKSVHANSIYDHIKQNTNGVQQNSSAMLDKISLLARADAKNADKDMVKSAINWLDQNRGKLFDSKESMETAIYYGSYLDAAFPDSDPLSKIGWQALKAVKYVYRGAESPSDRSSVRAVRKMSIELDKYLLTHP